jgi:hypothetical protein
MQATHRGVVAWFGLGLLFTLMLSACGGGGGEDGGNNQPPPNTVNLQGSVHAGTPDIPVRNANCQFIDQSGTQQGQATADTNGLFRLAVLPQLQGTVRCIPPDLNQLVLSTIISTEGAVAGDTLPATGREIISPQSTLIRALILEENPADRLARKTELLAQVADPNSALAPLAEAAAVLYQELLQAEVNVGIDTGGSESGEGGGDGGGGDSEGVSGDVGDGAEFSPIPNALCEYVLGLDETVLFPTLLDDLADGRVDRPDLAAVAERINQALAGREAAVRDAFVAFFPNGVGQPLRTTASGEDSPTPGRYFLPVPPGIPGYVRCRPPEQAELFLANFIPPRQTGQPLPGQNVNPATTVFSAHIATMLTAELAADADSIVAARDNFLEDIAGLEVGVEQENGNITGFAVEGPIEPGSDEAPVRLIAFAATALYTTLFTEGINTNFLTVVRRFVRERRVDPARLEEDAPEISEEQAQRVAEVVNRSTETAEEQLDTDATTLATARILVRVRSRRDGSGLRGAEVTLVEAAGGAQCTNCPQLTDAQGEATLTLGQVPTARPIRTIVGASLEDFESQTVSQRVIALARVTATITLRPTGTTGSGGGTN